MKWLSNLIKDIRNDPKTFWVLLLYLIATWFHFYFEESFSLLDLPHILLSDIGAYLVF